MGKGASFERKISKELSLWWSGGSRDDIFWRSCISGARATVRHRQGKDTFGSYGDIAAVDPVGQDLLRIVTIELKRGRSHGSPDVLIDALPTKAIRPFEAALTQARTAAKLAKSVGWLLLCQRDRRVSMVYLDICVWRQVKDLLLPYLRARYQMQLNSEPDSGLVRFVALRLEDFLRHCPPDELRRRFLKNSA